MPCPRIGEVAHLKWNLGDPLFFTQSYISRQDQTRSRFFEKTCQILKVAVALSSGHTAFDLYKLCKRQLGKGCVTKHKSLQCQNVITSEVQHIIYLKNGKLGWMEMILLDIQGVYIGSGLYVSAILLDMLSRCLH